MGAYSTSAPNDMRRTGASAFKKRPPNKSPRCGDGGLRRTETDHAPVVAVRPTVAPRHEQREPRERVVSDLEGAGRVSVAEVSGPATQKAVDVPSPSSLRSPSATAIAFARSATSYSGPSPTRIARPHRLSPHRSREHRVHATGVRLGRLDNESETTPGTTPGRDLSVTAANTALPFAGIPYEQGFLRFRAGKRQGAGSTPGAYSETMSPPSAMRPARPACEAG
jgi:hypothetical protein